VLGWLGAAVAAGGLVATIYLLSQPALTSEQQSSLNFLDSSLFDLEHPTPLNASVRELECADAGTKAEAYRKIPRYGIGRKVERFIELCSRDAARARDAGTQK